MKELVEKVLESYTNKHNISKEKAMAVFIIAAEYYWSEYGYLFFDTDNKELIDILNRNYGYPI